jgi:hypothetical protein
MFEAFVTWDMLKDYLTFVAMSFTVVQIIKELGVLKLIPTKALSIVVSFTLLILVNIEATTFRVFDLVIYLLSACVISVTANGIADATIKPHKK